MSEYQQKDDSGVLFKNDKKETDQHPDYKGNAMIDGTEYWFSAWINTSKTGTKYMKLSFNKKEVAHNNGVFEVQQAIAPIPAEQYADTDIPF